MAFQIDKVAEVHRQIDRVLLKNWDPIGVSDIPEAQDEFREYCRGVYDVAVKTRSARAIAQYLVQIEKESIGLSSRSADLLIPVATKILELVADVEPLP